MAILKTFQYYSGLELAFISFIGLFYSLISEPKKPMFFSLLLQLADAELPVGQSQGRMCIGKCFSGSLCTRAEDSSFQKCLMTSCIEFRVLREKTRMLHLNIYRTAYAQIMDIQECLCCTKWFCVHLLSFTIATHSCGLMGRIA